MEDNFIFDEILNKINVMNNILVDIKDGTDDIEQVNELFRAVHTIKGAADMLFIQDVVDIIHKSEDLLQEVRDGKIELTKSMVHLFVEIKDYIKLIVTNTFEGFTDDETVDSLKVYFDTKFEAFRSKIVLVVSSDSNVQTIDADELKGYTILKAKDFVGANNILKHCTISMLFLDVSMNEKLSVKFIETIKNTLHYDYLPVVLIVPVHYKNLNMVGKLTGAKAWLSRPVQKDKILLIIEKILG